MPAGRRNPTRHWWRDRVRLPCRTERHTRCRHDCLCCSDTPEATLEALAAYGIPFDFAEARETIATRGGLFLAHRGCRLDLFFNSIPLQEAASERTRQVDLLGKRVPILSAEEISLS